MNMTEPTSIILIDREEPAGIWIHNVNTELTPLNGRSLEDIGKEAVDAYKDIEGLFRLTLLTHGTDDYQLIAEVTDEAHQALMADCGCGKCECE